MGLQAKVNIRKWGWYPMGGGEVKATVAEPGQRLSLSRPGSRGAGQAAAGAGRVGQQQPAQAHPDAAGAAALQVLRSNGVNARIEVVDAPSKGQGTVVFLWAEFENALAGFTSLGERGKPAEQVAEEAAEDCWSTWQATPPLTATWLTNWCCRWPWPGALHRLRPRRGDQHLLTNAWVVNQFLPGRVSVEGQEGEPGLLISGCA